MTDRGGEAETRHRQVVLSSGSIHVVERGDQGKPAVLLLHGWPSSWASYALVMQALARDTHVLAIDLPGIGESRPAPPSGRKRALAGVVRELVKTLDLPDLTLVGHDAGGQIVFPYLHLYGETLARAAILNVVVPGLDPWQDVIRYPNIWHFAFHAIPELPERLVTGREEPYFDYFYDQLQGPRGVGREARRIELAAYQRPEALRAGFDWYRAFPQDAEDNLALREHRVTVPVLYLRGEKERGDLDRYLAGLRAGGLADVRGGLLPGSGHFSPLEAPEALASALLRFIDETSGR